MARDGGFGGLEDSSPFGRLGSLHLRRWRWKKSSTLCYAKLGEWNTTSLTRLLTSRGVLYLRPRKDTSPFVLVEFRSGSGMRKLASIANQVELKSPTSTVQVYIQTNESESRRTVSMSQDMSSLDEGIGNHDEETSQQGSAIT